MKEIKDPYLYKNCKNGIPLMIREVGEKCETVYHYTSMNGLVGILLDDYIYFRAGRFDCQNDINEFVEANNKLLPLILDRYGVEEKDVFNIYPYIISFSKEPDDLNLWRLYHSKVSLGIDLNKAFEPYKNPQKIIGSCKVAHEIIAGLCLYYSEKTLKDKFKIIEKYSSNECENNIPIQEALTLLKNDNYSYEKEYRISISDYDAVKFSYNPQNEDNVTITENELPVSVKEYVRGNGDICFYKELYFPKEALTSITIWEPNDLLYKRMKQNIDFLLLKKGYKRLDVIQSKHQFVDTH